MPSRFEECNSFFAHVLDTCTEAEDTSSKGPEDGEVRRTTACEASSGGKEVRVLRGLRWGQRRSEIPFEGHDVHDHDMHGKGYYTICIEGPLSAPDLRALAMEGRQLLAMYTYGSPADPGPDAVRRWAMEYLQEV